uniref:CSON013635 protein n=1 Tax=Culicoides sonorensis TaxID=179676 RepID=A0A336LH46_CULSO
MIDYIKFFQTTPKDTKRSQSPDPINRDAINALEMSRLALWNMYNNNLHPSPPNSQNSSPLEHQKRSLYNREADSPPPSHHNTSIKRERDSSFTDFAVDRDRDFSYPPEKKRTPSTPTRQSVQQHHLDTSTEERAETPIHENGTDLSKVNSKSQNKNGFTDSEPTSPALLNGMQFKIISRGKILIYGTNLHEI